MYFQKKHNDLFIIRYNRLKYKIIRIRFKSLDYSSSSMSWRYSWK